MIRVDHQAPRLLRAHQLLLRIYEFDARHLMTQLRVAGPPILFGVRLWASVCLALYIAFWLQLDNAYWAGTSAAIVCQPRLGASLRKASFRMIGTVVGAVAVVVLTASFPQNRAGFLLGLALWGAACGFFATTLRNWASHGATLAGVTAVIIAGDKLAATGGADGEAFMLALTRVSEICIGIVSAGLVLAGTDFGQARRQLILQFATLGAEITGGLVGTLQRAGSAKEDSRPVRRDLIRRVVALDPTIDEAIGEFSNLRDRSRELQAALEGLLAALSDWRIIANHFERLPDKRFWREASAVLQCLPPKLRSSRVPGGAAGWAADPQRMRLICAAAVRALLAMPADTPSLRLVADRTAAALIGMSRLLSGLALLTNVNGGAAQVRGRRRPIPDMLPAFVNAMRVFVLIGAAEVFWIVTAWPSGALAITWSAIFTIALAPSGDSAYSNAVDRLLGTCLAAALGAIVKFAVLPGIETFAGLGIVIGFVLIPAGALSTLSWKSNISLAVANWFLPFVGPENQITYDTHQYYNSALAIVAGAGAATLAFRLLPSLSPAQRARRLLNLTLRDLRRLASDPSPGTSADWERRVHSRMSVIPEQTELLEFARLAAALSLGVEIMRLRRMALRFDPGIDLETAFRAISAGNSAMATDWLARVERSLATLPCIGSRTMVVLRIRGSVLTISELLGDHASFFDRPLS